MSVNLDLPSTSSLAIDPYKDISDPLLPFALYMLVELDNQDITDIEQACNSQIETAAVRRAPNYDLRGEPLRSAWAEHLENVVPARQFDPFYFVAVVHKDWRNAGIILVTLDDGSDEEISHNDKMRVPAKDAGLLLVNMQLANVDWLEYKEEYESNTDNGNDYNDDPREPSKLSPYEGPQTDNTYSDGASDKLPNVKYWIGLYVIEGIDYETIMRELDPAFGPQKPTSELMCRPEGRVPSDPATALGEAARLHPMRCRNNKHLHRDMFLMVDSLNYREDGILLVQLRWDEKVEGRSLPELAAAGIAAQIDTQRLPTSNSETLTMFNEIKAGYRPWKHKHKTFLAYADPKTKYPHAYLGALDKSFQKRKSGSERFLEGWTQFKTTDHGIVTDGKGLEIVVDQHKSFVHKERFRSTLCPEYFVYSDREISTKDLQYLVTLVKVDQAGKWTIMQCPAGEVYVTLCELVDGKREWCISAPTK
ncbi:hypothetical protein B0J14DRAFT_609393 [Halenospora varia]|nr:hypothetical protein B0J14DRAFT_609393 [Halenospora varia]